MIVEKFIKYLATEKGRRFSLNSVCFTGMVMFSANYVPNTILVSRFKDIVQSYKFGEARKMSEKLQRRFEYAMDICKCTDFEKRFLHPFIAYGFDTTHLGSTKSRFGAYIGIPANYFYEKTSDIEKSELLIRNEEIKWSSDDGKALQESLVLSETEQVFGIARSILQVKTHKLLITSLYAPICLFSMYATGHILNQNEFVRQAISGMYSILGVFGFGLYSFLSDYTQVYYDTCVDKQLAEVGPDFVAAGVRFYEKMLKKNMALRNLSGENIYTAKGNENYFLRQKSLPLTIRKSFFEMNLPECQQVDAEKSVL